jgi:thymidine phosphorylase
MPMTEVLPDAFGRGGPAVTAVDVIRAKRDGGELTASRWRGCSTPTSRRGRDEQMSALLMAVSGAA